MKIKNIFLSRSFKSMAEDSSWTIFSQVFIVGINIFSVYILANLLSPENYGEFKLITTWLAIALGVGYTGYLFLLPQQIARGDKYDLKEIFVKTFIKSLAAALGLLIMSIYYLINQNLNLGSGFFFASLLAPVLCVSTLVNTYYMGRKNFKMFALAQNFVDTIQLLALCVFAYFSNNFILIISAYFTATIFANLLIIFQALKNDRKYKLSKEQKNVNPEIEVDVQSKMRSKLNLSNIILGFTNQIDKLLIFHVLGAAPLAIYSITTAISDQARTPVKAITAAMFPRMTSPRFNKKQVFSAFFLLTIVSIFIAISLIILYPFLFTYFFPKYVDYIYLANIATLSVVFAPTVVLYVFLQSKNDLVAINNYAYINAFLQVVLFSTATYFGSIAMFLYFKALIFFLSTLYQSYRIIKL